MPLSINQLKNICLYYGGCDQCRYLHSDPNYWDSFYCYKLKKSAKDKIDKNVQQFLNQCASTGKDPLKQSKPISDNCKGYPVLKHIQQGYDC